jgi:hypothetical protein
MINNKILKLVKKEFKKGELNGYAEFTLVKEKAN